MAGELHLVGSIPFGKPEEVFQQFTWAQCVSQFQQRVDEVIE